MLNDIKIVITVFTALDASDIGEMFCLVDKPIAKLFHKDMEFKITKRIIMQPSIYNET